MISRNQDSLPKHDFYYECLCTHFIVQYLALEMLNMFRNVSGITFICRLCMYIHVLFYWNLLDFRLSVFVDRQLLNCFTWVCGQQGLQCLPDWICLFHLLSRHIHCANVKCLTKITIVQFSYLIFVHWEVDLFILSAKRFYILSNNI